MKLLGVDKGIGTYVEAKRISHGSGFGDLSSGQCCDLTGLKATGNC